MAFLETTGGRSTTQQVGESTAQEPMSLFVHEQFSHHQKDREVSNERPAEFANRPCLAVFTVGSLPHEDVAQATNDYFFHNAEGGIVGWGQFVKRTVQHAPLIAFKDGELVSVTESHRDEMNYQTVAGNNDGTSVGIPFLVSAKGVGVQFTAGTIIEGKIEWDQSNFPDAKPQWEKIRDRIKSDFDALSAGTPVDLVSYALDAEAAPGFYGLLQQLQTTNADTVWAVKLQLTSPATVLQNIKDRNGVGIGKSEELADTVRELIALRNRKMVEDVRAVFAGRIILCADNPVAGALIAEDEDGGKFIFDAQMGFILVKDMPDVVLVEHSCSPIHDPQIISAAGLQGLHLDVYGYPEQIVNNAAEWADFLLADDRNILALGIVPTDNFNKFVEQVTGADKDSVQSDQDAVGRLKSNYGIALGLLVRKTEYLMYWLWKTGKFTSAADLYSRLCISSSCGQGTFPTEKAELVFHMMRDVSKILREQKLGIKEPNDD